MFGGGSLFLFWGRLQVVGCSSRFRGFVAAKLAVMEGYVEALEEHGCLRLSVVVPKEGGDWIGLLY
jgi:hypothetical protein